MVTVSEERERVPVWVPFRRPVHGDWSFWLCVAVTGFNLAAVLATNDGAVRIVDVVGLMLLIPVTWFIVTFVIGLPVAVVRQFRLGWQESRSHTSSRVGSDVPKLPIGRTARPLREAVAHAATPWEWRSRYSVLALVVISLLLPIAFTIDAWVDGEMNRLWALLWYGGIGSLVVVRPAIRSLRRWDERQRSSTAA